MIQVSPQMRILVAVEPVDFRAGIDALARLCKQQLKADPFCGWLFVFGNRRRTSQTQTLEAHELQVLLMGWDPAQAKAAPAWRRLDVAQ